MREIKFRAWDGEEMTFIPDLYWFEEQGVQYFDGRGHFANYDLMQFTGLHDKNGREIYEGDIIHLSGEDDIDYNALVVFKDGGFCAIDGTEDDYAVRRYGLMRHELDIRVIGNTHQHPDLLKEKGDESKHVQTTIFDFLEGEDK